MRIATFVRAVGALVAVLIWAASPARAQMVAYRSAEASVTLRVRIGGADTGLSMPASLLSRSPELPVDVQTADSTWTARDDEGRQLLVRRALTVERAVPLPSASTPAGGPAPTDPDLSLHVIRIEAL